MLKTTPGTTDGDIQSMILGRTKNTNKRLVRGCPCYKEFGDEKVCINGDDVLPIRAISVDPSFFAKTDSVEELMEFKSDKENMCYLLIYLDKADDFVYCVSRGLNLHINNKEVKASDIQAALAFVSSNEISSNGVVCSSCLYKYLVTLGDIFEDLITESERAEIIEDYVKEIYLKMAIELGGNNIDVPEIGDVEVYSNRIRTHIEKLSEQRTGITEAIVKLKKIQNKEQHIALLENYSQLCRLESIFLLQVMSLKESTDQFVAIGLLKFMIELSEQFVQTNHRIRETIDIPQSVDTIIDDMVNGIPDSVKSIIDVNETHRKMSERRFANLLRLLSQVRG